MVRCTAPGWCLTFGKAQGEERGWRGGDLPTAPRVCLGYVPSPVTGNPGSRF